MNVPVEAPNRHAHPLLHPSNGAKLTKREAPAGSPEAVCRRRAGGGRVADDTMKADTAHQLACAGTALMLWRGDFQNARLLLQTVSRRVDGLRRNGQPGKRVRAEPSQ